MSTTTRMTVTLTVDVAHDEGTDPREAVALIAADMTGRIDDALTTLTFNDPVEAPYLADGPAIEAITATCNSGGVEWDMFSVPSPHAYLRDVTDTVNCGTLNVYDMDAEQYIEVLDSSGAHITILANHMTDADEHEFLTREGYPLYTWIN